MAGKIAVDDETSLTPPPPAFLPPLKGTVRGKSPNGSFGSKRTGSETSLASRTPPTEGMYARGFVDCSLADPWHVKSR